MTRRVRWAVLLAAGFLSALLATVYLVALRVVPPVAAGGLLHPFRRPVLQAAPPGCADAEFAGQGVTLRGWRCLSANPPRGTLVFLHGVSDNRASVTGLVDRFLAKGLDVVAYDSRGHGRSGGSLCTYGYWEKRDLEKVLGTLRPGPVVLLGASLGAAVALQTAAEDARVTGVVSVDVFSDLRTVARDRAPRLLTDALIRRAFAVAEAQGDFHVDEVSPVHAAARIHVPVLVIHGAADTDTPTVHSRRVFAALAGPKELVLVKGARHGESFHSEETWLRIEAWLDRVLAR